LNFVLCNTVILCN